MYCTWLRTPRVCLSERNSQSHPLVWASGDKGVEAVHHQHFSGPAETGAGSTRPARAAEGQLLPAGLRPGHNLQFKQLPARLNQPDLWNWLDMQNTLWCFHFNKTLFVIGVHRFRAKAVWVHWSRAVQVWPSDVPVHSNAQIPSYWIYALNRCDWCRSVFM